MIANLQCVSFTVVWISRITAHIDHPTPGAWRTMKASTTTRMSFGPNGSYHHPKEQVKHLVATSFLGLEGGMFTIRYSL